VLPSGVITIARAEGSAPAPESDEAAQPAGEEAPAAEAEQAAGESEPAGEATEQKQTTKAEASAS